MKKLFGEKPAVARRALDWQRPSDACDGMTVAELIELREELASGEFSRMLNEDDVEDAQRVLN